MSTPKSAHSRPMTAEQEFALWLTLVGYQEAQSLTDPNAPFNREAEAAADDFAAGIDPVAPSN